MMESHNNVTVYDPSSIAQNVVNQHAPQILAHENELNELIARQNLFAAQLLKQNAVLQREKAEIHVDEMVLQTRLYHNKLCILLKGMSDLGERAQRIKKRALKLEQQKQRDALLKEQSRDRELEREKQLIARPAKRN